MLVIFRPARFGILLIRPLLEAFRDAFPAGVINIIYGDGWCTNCRHSDAIREDLMYLPLLGGVSRGQYFEKKQHPYSNRLRSVLGFDAKNPAIILPDADLEIAVSECINGALAFNGQRCTALKIIFVHRSIAAQFLQMFCQRVSLLKVGMPWEDDVTITPLPEPEKPAYLQQLVRIMHLPKVQQFKMSKEVNTTEVWYTLQCFIR